MQFLESQLPWDVACGNALDVLRSLPDESVQTCITSPPYFGLRLYSDDPQEIGQEETAPHSGGFSSHLRLDGARGETSGHIIPARNPETKGLGGDPLVCGICAAGGWMVAALGHHME